MSGVPADEGSGGIAAGTTPEFDAWRETEEAGYAFEHGNQGFIAAAAWNAAILSERVKLGNLRDLMEHAEKNGCSIITNTELQRLNALERRLEAADLAIDRALKEATDAQSEAVDAMATIARMRLALERIETRSRAIDDDPGLPDIHVIAREALEAGR